MYLYYICNVKEIFFIFLFHFFFFYFQEAYRRWVCSTLIPYFAEPDDIRQNKFVNNYDNTTTTTKNTTSTTNTHRTFSSNKNLVSQNLNTGLADHEKDPIVSRLLKR